MSERSELMADRASAASRAAMGCGGAAPGETP
jgi:hypothetical protein